MRILIVGAGAVGGYFGAWLLKAKRDVTFLVRPPRAQQLHQSGLQLLSPAGNISVPSPPTVTSDKLDRTFDLVLLSCKTFDLDRAMGDIAPAVGPETAILPLLNGMAHMDALDQRFGRRKVIGGATTISTTVDPDGRILHLNALDLLQFGDRDEPAGSRIHAIAQALTVPGYNAQLRPNIVYDMWQKWVGIAAAEGFPPSQPILDMLRARLAEPGSPFTASMLRDIESHKPIESEAIIGDVLVHARSHNLSAPLLDVVHAHLRCYEARRERQASSKSAPQA